MNKSILILDAEGTQTLSIVRSLYKNGYKIYGFFHSKLSYGYHTRYIHQKILIQYKSPEAYLSFVQQFLSDKKIDIIIPMSDNSAQFLSKNKGLLSQYSNFIVPDYDVFKKGYDKNELMKVCAQHNFPHPRTIDLKECKGLIDDKSIFPALIKPNYTTGGRGMMLVNNLDEFNKSYPNIRKHYGSCHLQEFIVSGGKQIKVQLFLDNDSNLLFHSVIFKQRYYPDNGGSSCCNITIEDKKLVDLCYQILKEIKWIGFADFDSIEDPKDGVMKIMEINPRIPACIKSAIKSGIDYGLIIADYSLGYTPKEYKYIPGKKLRHLGFDFLWFLHSPNRFKTKPNWFKFFEKNLYFQDFSWDDPLPFIFGTIGNIKKQFSSEFRKSKSGLQ
ncbi:MAG: ATP-grasp domain-containing protein [Prevotellaceae bacterium]|jgi:predicted ATP-grasp superfamily ATP-dependent carboligase|nr:ATP-grasp domain-containing protein [Prevotellaceae bacterium]